MTSPLIEESASMILKAWERTRARARWQSRRLVRDKVLLGLLRSKTWPTTADFSAGPHSVAASANDFMRDLMPGWGGTEAEAIFEEFALVREQVVFRRNRSTGSYPDAWSSRAEAQLALFAMVRLTQPALVLETGVADGESTVAILSALELNSCGELVSVDVASNVGGLVSDRERSRWRLHVVDPNRASQQLSHLLEGLPEIDVFFHDSDHSFHHQATELQLVAKRMRPGGIVACDDADSSFAFLDFCQSLGITGRFLFDGKRFLGVARMDTD